MKQPADLARRFLELAERDIVAFRVLAASAQVADQSVGFHAQQAVEKCIKAVLALHSVVFRRTHDLTELIALLQQHGLPLPPHATALSNLTPLAANLRYDADLSLAFDRARWGTNVDDVYRWARLQIP